MTGITRRHLLQAGLAMTAVPAAQAAGLPRPPADGRDWTEVAAQYDVTDEVVQLENGNWGVMARPVLAAYGRHLAMVNRQSSYYSRRALLPDLIRIRERAAGLLGCQPAELAFSRGATDSLLGLIAGYNRLRPGDAVLIADLDYDSMQSAMAWLKERRGTDLVRIAIPLPASRQAVIDAYAQALKAHPEVRLMLLTHVSHRTGLVMPVAEILAMARAAGVDVILDSAHAWGQLDFKLADLGADFVGLTCQKWIGAPMGVGLTYIRRSRLADIDRPMGIPGGPDDDAVSRVHTGTADFAALLTLEDAFDFHEKIGIQAKEARLRSLRDRWAEALRDHPGIDILTPADPRMTCAITSFRLAGRHSLAENRALARDLLDRFGIFTVERDGLASGACVRVTTALYTSEDQVDRLVRVLRSLA